MVMSSPFLQLAEDAPFVALDAVAGGDVLLLAPHPDDETLGCGCAIGALTDRGHRVQVVVITDGTQSHPHSINFPPAQLAMTRESELIEALNILTDGHGSPPVFLRYPDMAAPDGDAGADQAARRILPLITPTTKAIWSTWEGDPHPDHGRTARIMMQLGWYRPQLALWYYPIWSRFRPDQPQIDPNHLVRLHPSGQQDRKRRALAAYRSQMSGLITDDPTGFVMPPDKQQHFLNEPEIFLKWPR